MKSAKAGLIRELMGTLIFAGWPSETAITQTKGMQAYAMVAAGVGGATVRGDRSGRGSKTSIQANKQS